MSLTAIGKYADEWRSLLEASPESFSRFCDRYLIDAFPPSKVTPKEIQKILNEKSLSTQEYLKMIGAIK